MRCGVFHLNPLCIYWVVVSEVLFSRLAYFQVLVKTMRLILPISAKRQRFGFSIGFSMIEMLVVIAIISILLVAAVPILSNTSSNARQSSREIVKAHLRQARAHAISSGNATAIAIPSLATGGELGARAVTLFEVESDGSGYTVMTDADTEEELQLQRWEILPGKFHFVDAAEISGSDITVLDQTQTLETAYKGEEIICHMVVFSPSGQVVYPVGEVNIVISQAVRQGKSLRLTEMNGSDPVFEIFQVNRLTGRTRALRP